MCVLINRDVILKRTSFRDWTQPIGFKAGDLQGPLTRQSSYLEMDPHVPPRVADDRECAAGATTGGGCLCLLGSDSSGLDSCSTDRDSDELSMDLEKAFRGDSVGLQSFGVVAAESRRD